MNDRAELTQALDETLGGHWRVRALGLSGFTATYQAEAADGTRLFIKRGHAAQKPMLQAEAEGLAALRATQTVTVPEVIGQREIGQREIDQGKTGQGLSASGYWLALEWLDLTRPSAAAARDFGTQLAALHAIPRPQFGWGSANFLGATRQENAWTASDDPAQWWAFFAEIRLGTLAEALARRGGDSALLSRIEAVRAALVGCTRPATAALIHGDLWSGNWAQRADGEPVLFDPAVSVSDPVAELALLTLFGEPPAAFWSAYRAVHPEPVDFAWRLALYQLYHLLNHVLLFGAGYRSIAVQAAERVLQTA
ncbi:fructosamine kinase family protein [Halothiobacillus sp. DCM-1]|uniref:fructosamine kinase family protein n=1 Tax=Halothiobacillus sp. DCM-1 TaxID=3112558 RepID=UPI00324A411C